MIDMMWDSYGARVDGRTRVGDQVREVIGDRLCRVLWTTVRSLYFILSIEGNLFERNLKKSHMN